MVTASNEERLARLETGYEHLATKQDLVEMESRILSALLEGQANTNQRIDGLSVASNTRVDRVFWAVIGVGGGLLATAVASIVALISGAI